jgi:hypothetical protein
MTVYVDPLFATSPSKRWPYRWACHLTADTLEELHTFAQARLGLQRAWYQHRSKTALCHYDLTANKRRQALRAGATSLSGEQMAERISCALASQEPHQERTHS